MTDTPATGRQPRTQRMVGLTLAVAFLALLGASGIELGRRIARYNDEHAKTIWYFIQVGETEFGFLNRQVRIEATLDESTERTGDGTVTLSYGDDAETFGIAVPRELALPGLDRFTDWMGVYFFADSQDRPLREFRELVRTGDIPLRCVVVTRVPQPGTAEDGRFNLEIDPEDWGWGETMRDRWRFVFYELLPAGGIETTELKFPESGKSFYRRRVEAYRKGLPEPERDPTELDEGTWQWDAALRVMPRPPAITHEEQALLSAGWTLPAASLGALGFVVSLAFAFAPQRRRGEIDHADHADSATA